MGREGTGEGDPVDGRPGRHPSQPYPQGVLRAAFGCRQAQEGGLGSVHEEAALHPQRRDEGSRYLEVSSCPNPLTFKTVAFSLSSTITWCRWRCGWTSQYRICSPAKCTTNH